MQGWAPINVHVFKMHVEVAIRSRESAGAQLRGQNLPLANPAPSCEAHPGSGISTPCGHKPCYLKAGHTTARDLRQRSEEHTSELQSRGHLVCRLLLEK